MSCKKILVIDDEPDIREVLKELLELEGFQVITAANGQEALDQLKLWPAPCLILLDLMMPLMDGWEFLEVLQKRYIEVLNNVPIVVVSAIANVASLQKQYNCDIMSKPINVPRLIATARQHCL